MPKTTKKVVQTELRKSKSKKMQGRPTSSLKDESIKVLSRKQAQQLKVSSGTKITKSSLKTSNVKSGKISTTNIVDDIIDTTSSVLDTAIGSMSLNPIALAKIPSTIMKVVDTGSNIVKNFSGVKDESKIVLDKNTQIVGQNQKLVTELQKHMPVVQTTSVPSSFASQFTAPPLVVSNNISKNGVKITNVQGSNLYGSLSYGSDTSFGLRSSTRISPTASGTIFGSRVYAMALLFGRYRLNSFSIQFIPSQPTSSAGNIYIMAYNGTDDANFNVYTKSDVSQMENFVMSSGSQKASLGVRCLNPWLWTYQSVVTDPLKFYYQWCVAHYSSDNSSIVAGQLLFTFDLDFAQALTHAGSFIDYFKLDLQSIWVRYVPIQVSFDSYLSAMSASIKKVINASEFNQGILSDSFGLTVNKQLFSIRMKFDDSKLLKVIYEFLETLDMMAVESDSENEEEHKRVSFNLFNKVSKDILANFILIFLNRYQDFLSRVFDESKTSLSERLKTLYRVISVYIEDVKRSRDPWYNDSSDDSDREIDQD